MRIWAKTLSDSSLTMSVILRLTSFKILTGAPCRIFSSHSSLFSLSQPVPPIARFFQGTNRILRKMA